VIAMVLVALSLTACTTQQTTDIDRTAVVGAVYDEVGRPVVGAHITFGIRRGITDAAGRFRIENLRPGRYDVTVVAEDHARHASTATVQSRTQFVRIQLTSLGGLVDEAILELSLGATDRAGDVLARIEEIAPNDPRTTMLRRIMTRDGADPGKEDR
jgi:hypothetical protein